MSHLTSYTQIVREARCSSKIYIQQKHTMWAEASCSFCLHFCLLMHLYGVLYIRHPLALAHCNPMRISAFTQPGKQESHNNSRSNAPSLLLLLDITVGFLTQPYRMPIQQGIKWCNMCCHNNHAHPFFSF